MAKLSELLTGDPSTWRKVVRSDGLGCEGWVKFEFRVSNGEFVGIAECFEGSVAFPDCYDNWEYYEEPKKSNGYVCAPYADQHVYLNSNDTCECRRQKRLIPNVVLTDHNEPKPKVKRWIWASKVYNSKWSILDCMTFLSDEEFNSACNSKNFGSPWQFVKLPWTETSFDS